MRAAALQSLQLSCQEWLQREIRTSHLQQPRWPTRSPCRESPSCPPHSTSTSTSTSPASEPLPPRDQLPRLRYQLHQPAFRNQTQVMKTFPHQLQILAHLSESLLLDDVIKVSNACMVTI